MALEPVGKGTMGIETETLKDQANKIRQQLEGFSTIYGVPFDATDPDHLLVAAYLLGDKHGAIGAYESSLKAILNSVEPPTPRPPQPRHHWRQMWDGFWGNR